MYARNESGERITTRLTIEPVQFDTRHVTASIQWSMATKADRVTKRIIYTKPHWALMFVDKPVFRI